MTTPIEFTVDSRLRMSKASAKAHPSIVEELDAICTHDNPEFKVWLAFRRGRRPAQTITTMIKEKNGEYSFPRGIIDKAADIVGDHTVVKDNRVTVKAPIVKWLGPPARWYQESQINVGLELRNKRAWVGGVWRAPPGSGKTNSILELISKIGLKTLVVCPNNGVFGQWAERVYSHLGTEPGIIQGSKVKIGEIVTLVMQQTLWRRADLYSNLFGAVILDEGQLCGSKTYQEVINYMPAMFRMAVSGDERRADGKEYLVYDQFGPVVHEVTHEEVKEAGGIVEVEVIIVPTNFEADWYTKLPPDIKFLKRNELLQQMIEDEDRNNTILRIANACVSKESEQCLIISARLDQCNKLNVDLQKYGPSVQLVGGNKKEFNKNKEDFATGRAPFAVGTFKAVGVGFESHPQLARGIFGTPIGSNEKGRMQFKQFVGRYARPALDKKKAVVYYPLDVNVFGTKPAKLIRGWLGEENVFVQIGSNKIPVTDWIKNSEDYEENYEDEFDIADD